MQIREEDIDKLLLDQGFRNWVLKTDKQDCEYWESIIEGDDYLKTITTQAQKIILKIEEQETSEVEESHSSYARLEHKTNPKVTSVDLIHKRKHTMLGRFSRLAAVVTFLLAFVVVIYLILDKDQPLPIQQEEVWIQKSTENGQKLSIRLPDGSLVKLNANSNISFSKNFSQNRNVKLSGEAFFNVASDSLHPFVVSTAHFQTKVLGTSFNVQAYGTQNSKVSVEEGLVQVAALKQQEPVKYLEMHQAVEIDGDKLYSAKFNHDEILWKDGVLVFSDEDIQSITAKIERWYDVKIRIQNGTTIPNGFSGKYSNESLEEVLTGMSYALGFAFELNGNELIIKGKEKL